MHPREPIAPTAGTRGRPCYLLTATQLEGIWFCCFQIQIFKLGRENVAGRLSPASAGYSVFITNGSDRPQSPTGATCDSQSPTKKGKLGNKTKTPACKARTGVSAKSLFRLCAPFHKEAPEWPWSLEKLPGLGCLAQRLDLCRSSQVPLAHGPRPHDSLLPVKQLVENCVPGLSPCCSPAAETQEGRGQSSPCQANSKEPRIYTLASDHAPCPCSQTTHSPRRCLLSPAPNPICPLRPHGTQEQRSLEPRGDKWGPSYTGIPQLAALSTLSNTQRCDPCGY